MDMKCPFCGDFLRSRMHYGMHNLSYHSDSWAVIDLLEAGVSENDANKYYDKCMNQVGKKLGRKRHAAGSRRSKRSNDALSMNTENGYGYYPKYDTEIPQSAFGDTSNVLYSDTKVILNLTDTKVEELSTSKMNLESIGSELRLELGIAESEQQSTDLTSLLSNEIKPDPDLSNEKSDEDLCISSEASELNKTDEDGEIADAELKCLMSEIYEILLRKRPNAQ